MRARTPLLLTLLLASCQLGPIELTGLRCAEDRPCGEGFVCVSAHCLPESELIDAGDDDAGAADAGEEDAGTPDAGIPRGVNLLSNSSFEQFASDGGVPSWRASTGRFITLDGGHSGNRAGRLQSSSFQQTMTLIPSNDVDGPELGMLFCASVWLRADADAGVDVTLAIRDRFFDGGTSTSSGTRVSVRTGWVQVKEEFATIGTSTIQFRVSASSRFDAGDGFAIDDAWLSRADPSGCPP